MIAPIAATACFTSSVPLSPFTGTNSPENSFIIYVLKIFLGKFDLYVPSMISPWFGISTK